MNNMRNFIIFFLLYSTYICGFSQEEINTNKELTRFTFVPTKVLIEKAKEENGIVKITEKGDTIIATKTWIVMRNNSYENKEFTRTVTKGDNKNINYSLNKKRNHLFQLPTKDLIQITKEQNGTIEITENGDTILTTRTFKIIKK